MILQYGDYNFGVMLLQVRLNNIRAWRLLHGLPAWGPCTIDGHFGFVTLLNLAQFQTDYGLTPDGIYGPATDFVMRLNEAQYGIVY
jgi:peptidoglycan hydrolase-like protein with peptidoglycan-binding domain